MPPPAPVPMVPTPYYADLGQRQPYMVMAPVQRPTSTYATLSLVFGILGLVTVCCSFGLFSLGAVVFGHAAMGETRKGIKGGHGMMVAGLVLGYLGVIPAVVLSIMAVTGGLFNTTP